MRFCLGRKAWATAVTHGDLNLNNVLVDERRNIYVIDFSETRIRNVASDFARIEPMGLLQWTRLAGAADAAGHSSGHRGFLARPPSGKCRRPGRR